MGFMVWGVFLVFKYELMIRQNQNLLIIEKDWSIGHGTILSMFFIKGHDKIKLNYIALALIEIALVFVLILIFIGVKWPEIIIGLRNLILGY